MSYKKSSGHDVTLDLEILYHIIREGNKKGVFFIHEHIQKDDQKKEFKIPYSVFAISEKMLTHSDPKKYYDRSMKSVCTLLITCLVEDCVGALSTKHTIECFQLFESITNQFGKIIPAPMFMGDENNIYKTLLMTSLMYYLPKSLLCLECTIYGLLNFDPDRKIDEIDYEDGVPGWFQENIVNNPEFGSSIMQFTWSKETILTWNFYLAVKRRNLEDSIVYLVHLWIIKRIMFSSGSSYSKFDTVKMIHICLEHFLGESMHTYSKIHKWFEDHDVDSPCVLVAALLRAIRFQEGDLCSDDEFKKAMKEAKKTTDELLDILIYQEWSIHVPWENIPDKIGISFKNVVSILSGKKRKPTLLEDLNRFHEDYITTANGKFSSPLSNRVKDILLSRGFMSNAVGNTITGIRIRLSNNPRLLEDESMETDFHVPSSEHNKKRKRRDDGRREMLSRRARQDTETSGDWYLPLDRCKEDIDELLEIEGSIENLVESQVYEKPNTIVNKPHCFWTLTKDSVPPYFKKNHTYFVHGPFKNEQQFISCMLSNKFKKLLKSNYLKPLEMKVARFSEDRTYLFCQDLYRTEKEIFSDESLVSEEISKTNGEVKVLRKDRVKLAAEQLNRKMIKKFDNDGLKLEFCCTMLYRYLFRINGTTYSDFVLTDDNHIYSTHEYNIFASSFQNTLFRYTIKQSENNVIRSWFNVHWTVIRSELDRWYEIIKEDKTIRSILDKVGYSMEEILKNIDSLRTHNDINL